ncbi:hypothetical protein OKW38_002954 [Paraburkholderia sp. MM5496-R1]|uniref:KilA-N domain-containing protein n=1 Tax=unclassified Paraburkholderia TaxID=2615204 RepID=UPI003D21E941
MATTKNEKGRTPAKSAALTTRANDTALRIEYDGELVEFTKDGWINATQVAARFGKRLDSWLRSPETQEYIAALAAAINSHDSGDLIRTQRGRIGGTRLHPKLGVLLARWCSARFAVWCDLQIDHILRGGLSLLEKDSRSRSTTPDREPLLTVAAAIVARHRLPFGAVYEALDLFAGVTHAREMTCAQVADTTAFGDRLLSGTATPADFARIEAHRTQLGGERAQLPLVVGGLLAGDL